jgi:hypothetical protein
MGDAICRFERGFLPPAHLGRVGSCKVDAAAWPSDFGPAYSARPPGDSACPSVPATLSKYFKLRNWSAPSFGSPMFTAMPALDPEPQEGPVSQSAVETDSPNDPIHPFH